MRTAVTEARHQIFLLLKVAIDSGQAREVVHRSETDVARVPHRVEIRVEPRFVLGVINRVYLVRDILHARGLTEDVAVGEGVVHSIAHIAALRADQARYV